MEVKESPLSKIKTPEDEFSHLREKISINERMGSAEPLRSKESDIRQAIEDYKENRGIVSLHPSHEINESEKDAIVLKLSPETHDKKMEELLGILLERGVKNALDILEKLDDPHVDDDFHRFLVQYLVSTGGISGLKTGEPLHLGINMKLYRIAVPRSSNSEEKLSDFISRMEQFYAGMLSVSDGKETSPGKNYFTLEIALPNGSNELAFYSAVPRDKATLFEKQFLAYYPGSTLNEVTDDYNVFVERGASIGAVGVSTLNEALSIKTYNKFDNDPIEGLLGAFSKIKKEGEGVAIQILISPAGDYFIKRFGKVLEDLGKGVSLREALPDKGMFEAFARVGRGLLGPDKKKEINLKEDNEAVKLLIKEKIASTIANSNLRIIVSAESTVRAKELIGEITASFSQLREPQGNGISFEIKEGRSARALFHQFSYRLFSEELSVPLNLKELATIFHIPRTGKERTGNVQIFEAKTKTAPAPLNISDSGTVLGINKHQGSDVTIKIADEDRMRHLYVIGQTGTGKTTLMKNMVIQDIKSGHGVCMIDPHGSDLEEILANIPESRIKDVIYFDPGYSERPLGLNMLEYDTRFPEQKTFVVNELLAIFNKLFDMKVAGGPAFEQYFRNAAFLVMEHPESGNTLLEISRVMSDRAFRDLKLSHCSNPLILQFWQNALKTTGDQGLANFVPYITNKFDVFLSNDIMRPIVAQEKSAFNFRDVMDQKKILLVNLSKGRLGDINSALLGLILVGKLLQAALSRADILASGKKPEDFYLYIDEFQNVTTDSISTIFSEARKYRLSLTVAHQYIKQLDEKIKNSVFGNVGSLVSFRVGQEDAEYMEKQFTPIFSASDITSLENRNAYVRLLVKGEPQKPFNIETVAPEKGTVEMAKRVKEYSYSTYGKPKAEIENLIRQKYTPPPTPNPIPKTL